MAARRIQLDVQGMHCDACVASVRENLLHQQGVSVVEVQVGRATVAYDDADCSTGDLVSAVRSAGDFDVAGYRPL